MVRWLYTLFLALDANFRMSRKGVSSAQRDPGLVQGQAYFVDETAFAAHLEAHKDQRQEVMSFSPILQHMSLIYLLAQ